MSGLEVGSLVVGILPLVVGAVRTYSSISTKFSTYRHYSSEVRRLWMRFQVQQQNFLNECQLLLQIVVEDGQTGEEMLENFGHALWNDRRLNEQLKKHLNNNYECCKIIIEECQVCLEDIDQELKCYDILLTQKVKGESLRETVRRVRRSISIPFKKAQFEQQLQYLRDLNADVSLQRSYIDIFQKHRTTSFGPPMKQQSVPRQYHAVRIAAQHLHEALMTAWCCTNMAHTEHCARLFLDARLEQEEKVSLNMAISIHSSNHNITGASSITESPVWLYIQSTTVKSSAIDEQEREAAVAATTTPAFQNNPQPDEQCMAKVPSKHAIHCNKERTVKRRKLGVRFASDAVETSIPNTPGFEDALVTADPIPETEVDLGQTESVCEHFKQKSCSISQNTDHCHHCVGYLELPQRRKHTFYCPGSRDILGRNPSSPMCDNIVSLAQLLQQVPEDTLEIDDQLKLAHCLAKTILQFHSTPWLEEEWRIENLHLLGSTPNRLSDSVLQSLHTNALFPDCRKRSKPLPMEGITETPATVKATSPSYSPADILYGVRNMTLFSLGVALIEIGRWRSLQYADTEDPIITVRKMARRPLRLGSRYREIVRACLECDFGYGNDLSNSELQSAVYGGVVCQLEDMMKKLNV